MRTLLTINSGVTVEQAQAIRAFITNQAWAAYNVQQQGNTGMCEQSDETKK
jgi:hypothetical protein